MKNNLIHVQCYYGILYLVEDSSVKRIYDFMNKVVTALNNPEI